jgi:hypothetical protein
MAVAAAPSSGLNRWLLYVQRHDWAAVPHPAADFHDIDTRGDQRRGVRVPQGVGRLAFGDMVSGPQLGERLKLVRLLKGESPIARPTSEAGRG